MATFISTFSSHPPLASLLVSLFLLVFCLSLSVSNSQRCNPVEKKVLLNIKKALNDPYILASWDPKTDCCGWYQLRCDERTGNIAELTIFGGELNGQIPPEVGDLPHLETLLFRKLSNLSGHIQPTIAKLKNLKEIRLSWTNLSGPIPEFLGTLKNLTYLDLSFNQLSGTIPATIAELTSLSALHLDRNRLSGPIPDSFGRFRGSIPWIYLSHNQLSGHLPESFVSADFPVIDLSRNRLEGDASALFRDASRSTTSIVISRNLFEFDLSGAIFPENLVELDISHNRIWGPIPSQITALKSLVDFNVSYNRLCGEIPLGGKLQSFDVTTYFHNRCLCGPPLSNCTRGLHL